MRLFPAVCLGLIKLKTKCKKVNFILLIDALGNSTFWNDSLFMGSLPSFLISQTTLLSIIKFLHALTHKCFKNFWIIDSNHKEKSFLHKTNCGITVGLTFGSTIWSLESLLRYIRLFLVTSYQKFIFPLPNLLIKHIQLSIATCCVAS